MGSPAISRLFAAAPVALLAAAAAVGGETERVELPPRERFHVFLLAGQSNMAGRGEVEDGDRKAHPRVFALSREGQWRPAVDPIHFDKGAAGVGLGRSFGIALADRSPEIAVGLVPAACGGSSILSWKPGAYFGQTKSHPYDDAVARAKLAMKRGTLKGILWHQGESDCRAGKSGVYREGLAELIGRFRKDLDAPGVPFIIGQLGRFPGRPWSDERKQVNDAHVSIAKESPDVGFVPSAGLTCRKDNTHFDAKSLREFGRRYAEVYLKIAEGRPRTKAGKPPR